MTVIAIDGPAGAGKSSVARAVAEELDVLYVDTGAMYRAVALATLDAGIDPSDAQAVSRLVERLQLDGSRGVVQVDGQETNHGIRSPEVTRAAATVAQHKRVRDALVALQRELAKRTDVVMEGRDIGTAVFPAAEVKIFLTASLDERIRRRVAQLGLERKDARVREIARDIAARDESDRTRAASPLKQAPDAIVVDTTEMTAAEVVERISSIARRALDREARS